MRKITFTVIVLLAMTLTACGGATSTPQADPSKLDTSYSNALPVAAQLLVGTLKLDGTNQAVTVTQAKALIPLWQVYEGLSTSDTAAQEEINALIDQIQETLTADQIQTIKSMQLTTQDMFTAMQAQGITGQGGGGGTFGQGSSANGGNGISTNRNGGSGRQFFFQDGAPGGGSGGQTRGGGGFGGGGFGGGGQGVSPQQIATAQARRSQNGGGGFRLNNVPTPLVQAMVKYLQQKAGS